MRTKIQMIRRRSGYPAYTIEFPSEITKKLQIKKGEVVELIIQDNTTVLIRRDGAACEVDAKENSTSVQKGPGILRKLKDILGVGQGDSKNQRTMKRVFQHVTGFLTCTGRHTISGVLTTLGQQFCDWTAAYRIYSRNRFSVAKIFHNIQKGVENELDKLDKSGNSESEGTPLVVSVDDSVLPKRGSKKTKGVEWRRDPMSPPFSTNFVLGLRVLQLSAALPAKDGSARAIPIDFILACTAKKPRRNATDEEKEVYKKKRERLNLSRRAVARLRIVRRKMDKNRKMVVVGDGGYTNGKVLRHLPNEMISYIGRIRGNANLHYLPQDGEKDKRGRPRMYGAQAPTPEELLKDNSVPWETVKAFAAGKTHEFRVKTLSPVRWYNVGKDLNLRLIVIAPVGYRKTKNGRLLYREPAYLICTDDGIPLEKIVQYYIWRSDIELNFRDEKSVLGVGEAQVRSHHSVAKVPSLAVAAYGALLLAGEQLFKNMSLVRLHLEPSSWQANIEKHRPTTLDYMALLRKDLKIENTAELDGQIGKQYLLESGIPPPSLGHNSAA